MKTRPRINAWARLIFALLVIFSSGASHAQSNADARFETISTQEWKWRQLQEAGGEDNTMVRPHLPDISPEAQAARIVYLERVRRDLDAIRTSELSPRKRVDYAVYTFQIDTMLDRLRYREFEKPLNADSSFWTDLGYVARGTFRTESVYRNWITQLNELPRYFEQHIANMRAGRDRGFTPPKVTLTGRDSTISSVVDAAGPEQTYFYLPFKTMPSNIPRATQAALRAEAVKAIRERVIPAHRTLLSFMRNEYVPRARESLAAEALPDGKNYYRALIRQFASVELTADEIHAIGLSEVQRIRQQMAELMRQTGFRGDLPAFLSQLRSDPRFYAKSADELLREAAWITKQVDAKLPLYFGRLPRQRFTVAPVPADLAPNYTSARGGPGAYLVNTYNLRSRPLFALRALTLHEAAPGHAFQMPLALENKEQPEFRRHFYVNAYGEGWALYCEWLGQEMGIYETPYDQFGMLSYQMWRAARLVVDTGIHAKGWTRKQAQDFLSANTALTSHEVETEVDRYISWPAQALGYYLGEMAFLKGRARAETALGNRFNIRAFHDTVLSLGAVPLPVLEQEVDRFISSGGVGPYPDED
ncbi:MAG TPA: DUF885 family protein [Sphingomicrobium sp.]|nr:DUF885 family protein [Sphingomicrobium sp.]